ncbi:hypothetical protein SAMN05444921_115189 [Streptomyces wuyuanensis]|uniref:Uncharacterized protein n=1 Tax=Streptomyces wuyuanensis TaxID=1196353 RepID=A0A1G9XD43_9ACTN|nr:hypothetical protein SAMN05444921_115189 [Streptomyces wuyuanensis]
MSYGFLVMPERSADRRPEHLPPPACSAAVRKGRAVGGYAVDNRSHDGRYPTSESSGRAEPGMGRPSSLQLKRSYL